MAVFNVALSDDESTNPSPDYRDLLPTPPLPGDVPRFVIRFRPRRPYYHYYYMSSSSSSSFRPPSYYQWYYCYYISSSSSLLLLLLL